MMSVSNEGQSQDRQPKYGWALMLWLWAAIDVVLLIGAFLLPDEDRTALTAFSLFVGIHSPFVIWVGSLHWRGMPLPELLEEAVTRGRKSARGGGKMSWLLFLITFLWVLIAGGLRVPRRWRRDWRAGRAV
jgi:hypothetical protein